MAAAALAGRTALRAPLSGARGRRLGVMQPSGARLAVVARAGRAPGLWRPDPPSVAPPAVVSADFLVRGPPGQGRPSPRLRAAAPRCASRIGTALLRCSGAGQRHRGPRVCAGGGRVRKRRDCHEKQPGGVQHPLRPGARSQPAQPLRAAAAGGLRPTADLWGRAALITPAC